MPRPSSSTPTDWELVLMKILWDHPRSSVDGVREVLRSQGLKRSDSAVRKMLQILAEKGLASTETEGRTTYYSPAVKRKRLEKNIFQHLIHGLFGGNQEQFLLRALDETKVTPEVVKRMKEILREQDEDDARS